MILDLGYTKASSEEEALEAMAEGSQARFIAGGTDLVPLMKDGIARPDTLIDIKGLAGARDIQETRGGLRIGPLVTLAELAKHPVVARDCTALAEACRRAATPQLRNMSTIAGNLLQQTRCWYFRGPFECWLKGGENCYARKGENEYHSVFVVEPWVSPCVSAHPSDPAAALLALGATVHLRDAEGEREIAVDDLFARPSEDRRSFVTIGKDTLVTGISVPKPGAGARSFYLKAMARASWAFALAGIAMYLEMDGDQVKTARVALSGVAPIPLRRPRVEDALVARGRGVDREALGQLLVEDAQPLQQNGYKLHLLRGLLKEALRRAFD